jgi:predicted MPP superfamily phosphohydrolase
VLNSALSTETPDLVVLNGDLITGENTYRENSSEYVHVIVRPLLQRGFIWASTYGNHDSDFNLSRQAIFERETQYPNCRTQNMVQSDDAGVSNYYLPVFPSQSANEDNIPELLLWFFDSRGGNKYQETDAEGEHVPIPSWVDQSVSYSIL